MTDSQDLLAFAREALAVEAEAIHTAASRLGPPFLAALELLSRRRGKVVTTGIGKSGLAARKLAATLTSTGCLAVFLHPSDAMHGDLGIVAEDDVVIAVSNSGESEELLAILPGLLARGVSLIAIVGGADSSLAHRANIVLDASVEREVCPLNLAPTTSVVVAVAIGDALAVTLQKKTGFGSEDYARNHPGGRIGRRLTLRVRDIMPAAEGSAPSVRSDASLMDVLTEISKKGMGATGVMDDQGGLVGIITDYDIRIAFQARGNQLFECTAAEVMNANPAVLLSMDRLAYEALRRMEDRPRPVSVAPVLDNDGAYAGMLRLHDLLRAGL